MYEMLLYIDVLSSRVKTGVFCERNYALVISSNKYWLSRESKFDIKFG